MVHLSQLWLPILLSAVLIFVASSAIHMVFKWHNSEYRQLPNEEAVLEALRKGSPAPGQYLFPFCADHRDLGKPDMKKKYEQGPLGLVWLKAGGMPEMGGTLGAWFLYNLVLAFCVAYLVSRTTPLGAHYLQVFRVAGTVMFLAHAGGTVPSSIWMGKPWRVTVKEILDGLIYSLLTAGAFGWLWPR